MRIERLRQTCKIEVRWVYFPLHPETPPDGTSLAELFAGRNLDVASMHQRMNALMEAEGLPYGLRTHTYNSRLAQELSKWAESLPDDRGIHDALYRAYFAEGRNLSRDDVLLDVVRSIGLPEDAAQHVLVNRTFKEAVDADWARARSYGVNAVPTFVADRHAVRGAHPYEILEQLVRQAGAELRAG